MSLGNNFRNREPFIAPKLQITAMMDMFTIIVFFLLFSYAEKPDEVQLNSNIDLPSSSTQSDYENTIKVFLSPDTLKIEDQTVANIRQGKIIDFDPKNPRNSRLYKTLEKIRKDRLELQEKMNLQETDTQKGGAGLVSNVNKNKPQVLFFCDKSVPFKVINSVMKTIGMVGYPNMQFAVTGE
jgi:Biopolymer transport protein ExbD/TolR.